MNKKIQPNETPSRESGIVIIRNNNGVTVEKYQYHEAGRMQRIGDSYVFTDAQELFKHITLVLNFPPLLTAENSTVSLVDGASK